MPNSTDRLFYATFLGGLIFLVAAVGLVITILRSLLPPIRSSLPPSGPPPPRRRHHRPLLHRPPRPPPAPLASAAAINLTCTNHLNQLRPPPAPRPPAPLRRPRQRRPPSHRSKGCGSATWPPTSPWAATGPAGSVSASCAARSSFSTFGPVGARPAATRSRLCNRSTTNLDRRAWSSWRSTRARSWIMSSVSPGTTTSASPSGWMRIAGQGASTACALSQPPTSSTAKVSSGRSGLGR